MNWLDILLCVFSGLFLWRGLQVGFIKAALFYTSLLCGFIGSLFLEPSMNHKWQEWGILIPIEWVSIASWIFLFIVITMCAHGVGLGIRLILKPILAGSIDRFLGLILGIVKTVGFVILICWSLSKLSKEMQTIFPLETSVIYECVKIAFPFVETTWNHYKGTPFEMKNMSNLFKRDEPKEMNENSKKKQKTKSLEEEFIKNYPEAGGSNWDFPEGKTDF